MTKQVAKRVDTSSKFKTLGLASIICLTSSIFTLNSFADINVARTYMQQGNPDAALLELDGDIAANPADPEARFLKGVALQAMGRTNAAIEMYSGLVHDFPELPEPHNNLAVLFADKKQFDKAENSLRAAIKTNESYSTAYENLGDIYAQRASIAYTDALNRDPVNREAVALKLSIIDRILLPPSAQQPIPVQVANNTPAQTPVNTQSEPVVDPPVQQNTPVKTTTQPSASASEVRSTVMSWANAWSSRDVSNYLSHYAETFRPVGGASRAAWAKYRSERLQKPSFVIVNIDQLNITENADGSANASFVQDYQSDGYQDTVKKSLRLINTSGGWKIQKEQSSPM